MARSARKPEREAGESAKQALTKPGKTIATPAAGEVGKTAAKAASAASLKPDIEFAGFQSGQFESLRAVLEKRSDASASARTIAEEFAALWLPVHAVDLELLVPALREAGVPESQSYAARVRKDLLNIVLADLIGNDHVQDTSGARLEALSSIPATGACGRFPRISARLCPCDWQLPGCFSARWRGRKATTFRPRRCRMG